MTQYSEGAMEVLVALASGDRARVEEAVVASRERFKEEFGCYPEEMAWVCGTCEQPGHGADECPGGRT